MPCPYNTARDYGCRAPTIQREIVDAVPLVNDPLYACEAQLLNIGSQ